MVDFYTLIVPKLMVAIELERLVNQDGFKIISRWWFPWAAAFAWFWFLGSKFVEVVLHPLVASHNECSGSTALALITYRTFFAPRWIYPLYALLSASDVRLSVQETNIMTNITTNADQRLFIIPCGKGFSCLGFDVCKERAERLATWLNLPAPTAEVGSVEYYTAYQALTNAAKVAFDHDRKRCPVELSPQLVGLEGRRVEVVDEFGDKRRFYVGRSTGWIPVHLEIARRDSSGGGAADREYKSVTVVR